MKNSVFINSGNSDMSCKEKVFVSKPVSRESSKPASGQKQAECMYNVRENSTKSHKRREPSNKATGNSNGCYILPGF